MNVFLSSVIAGFGDYRDAAVQVVEDFGHDATRAEDFPASASSAQVTCLAGVRNADLVVLLLGGRYGEVQASGKSATHEEFEEARSSKPLLAFIQQGVPVEPRQQTFIDEVQAWASGSFTVNFESQADLRTALTRALHQWEISNAVGSVDEAALRERVVGAIPDNNRYGFSGSRRIVFSIAGAPHQQIIRPTEIESAGFQREIKQEALFGAHSVFDDRDGTATSILGGSLVLKQANQQLRISEDGSLYLEIALPHVGHGLSVIIEEDVRDTIVRGIRFLEWVMSRVDAMERQSHVALAIAIHDVGVSGWQEVSSRCS